MSVCFVLSILLKSENLRHQLQEAEDGLVGAQRDLIQAHRELQDVAQDRDRQRKETLDLRRSLGDEVREKESIQATNQELRALVKRAESDNSRYGSVGPLECPTSSPSVTPKNILHILSKVILSKNVFCEIKISQSLNSGINRNRRI